MKNKLNKTSQKFVPTEEMKKCLLAYADMSARPTIEDRMKAVGLRRETWYYWCNEIEGFVEWWKTETEKIMQRSLSELDKIAYMKAGSDYRYMELLQMKYGGFKKKQDVTSDDKPMNYTLEIIDKTEDVEDTSNQNIQEDGTGEQNPQDYLSRRGKS